MLPLLVLLAVVRPHVLFLGNSLTYTNDMPQMVERIAQSKNVPLSVEFIGRGGALLMNHWQDEKALAAIRARNSDFVVLQPQSAELIGAYDNSARYAALLNDEIRRSGAKTVLFLTWAPLGQPVAQEDYTRRTDALARQLGAIVAPVGVAWERLQQRGVKLFGDNVHPNAAGSYLAACVFFSVATGKSPVGASYAPVDRPTADAIQRAAWDAVRESMKPAD